jgi:hypothetical protein
MDEKEDKKKEHVSVQKKMKNSAKLERSIFKEVSAQFDQLFQEKENSKHLIKISDETVKKKVSKPLHPVRDISKAEETAKAEKKKRTKKVYVIQYAADEPKKESSKAVPPKPPPISKEKKPEKVTAKLEIQADKTPKSDAPVDKEDAGLKLKVTKEAQKQASKPAPPAKETLKTEEPTKDDKKKEDQIVDRKKHAEKIDVKVSKKKSSYKAYVLAGALIVLVIVIALSLYGSFKLFKKKNTPQKITAQKTIKMPLNPKETKAVAIKKKTIVQASGSVEVKDKASLPKKSPEKQPLVTKKKEMSSANEVNPFLRKWKTAWENTAGPNGDIETYMSFYASDFSASGLDKSGWKQDKAQKNKRKDWIRIGLKNINIVRKIENNGVEVNFLQDFQSSNYSGISDKTLILMKEESGWKIIGIKRVSDLNR